MISIFFVTAVNSGMKNIPVIVFTCSEFMDICNLTKQNDLSPLCLQELYDPTEASVESTGHGGYLCQSGGE